MGFTNYSKGKNYNENMTLTFKGTQRVHNLFKSRLIQSIIHPLIIIPSLLIVLLISYKEICLNIVYVLSGADVLGSNSAGFPIIGLQIQSPYPQFNLSGLINGSQQTQLDLILFILETNKNDALHQFNLQKHNILNSTKDLYQDRTATSRQLSIEFEQNLTKISQNYSDQLNNLSSSVMELLQQQETVIANYKTQLSNSLYVGQTINIDGLALNISGIQELLENAADQNIVDVNNVTISSDIDLNNILGDISQVFDDAINQLQDMDYSSQLSLNTTSLSFDLNQMTLNSSSSNSINIGNSTESNSSINTFKFQKDLNGTVISIGIMMIFLYLLILLYQYFKFRYEFHLKIKQFIELEKVDSSNDYIQLMQEFGDPHVSMITDIELNIINDSSIKAKLKNKLYWLNDYIFSSSSNIPFLGVFVIFILILIMTISKETWDLSSTNTNHERTEELNITKTYMINQIDGFKDPNKDLMLNFQGLLTSQMEEAFIITSNLTENLEKIQEQYLLNITIPMITMENNIGLPDISVDPIENVINSFISGFNQIQIKQTVNMSSSNYNPNPLIQIQNILHSVHYTFFRNLTLLAIILSALFLCIVLIGCVYAFYIEN